jgi:hypothetical protein
MKHHFRIPVLAAITSVALTASSSAAPIADFVNDFPAVIGAGPQFSGSETPAPGWDYMWNPGGTSDLGVSANYQSLVPNTVNVATTTVDNEGLFTNVGNIAFNVDGQGNFKFGRVGIGSSHPGQSGSDYRAIFAYTIQSGEAGTISIIDSSILMKNATGTNGIDVGVYVNDSLLSSFSLDGFNSTTATNFNGALGTLVVGDTVYVTVGHNGNPGNDAFVIDFTLELDYPNYDDWAAGVFEKAFTDTDPTHNPDGDTLTNLQEFAFGTDPTATTGAITLDGNGNVTNGKGTPIPYLAGLTETTVDYRAVFSRRKDHVASELTYTVEFSTLESGSQWVASTASPTTMDSSDPKIDVVYVPYPALIQTTNGFEKPRFFRVGVSRN